MPSVEQSICIDYLDVSTCSYNDRICIAALQGLVNRSGPKIFLDYGIYDDPNARRTNEVFLDDTLWYSKYRDLLGDQDQRNLDYYQAAHHVRIQPVSSLDELIDKYRQQINGCVLWDANLPDTVNIALMLCAQEGWLPVEASRVEWAEHLDLVIQDDLCGKWPDRMTLYQWALDHLLSMCKPGMVACVEPGWQRPEFIDFLVQQKVFIYSLSSQSTGWGDNILLLLAFGPAWLRELVFSLRLDGGLRRLGLALMDWSSVEVRLNSKIQHVVKSMAAKASFFPTIFGWHTQRDNELKFMLHLSANGLRLVPAHLSSNFSFHDQVKPLGFTETPPVPLPDLDPQGTYVTFSLSDGDQLMMMSTGELGNWYSQERGSVPFNWETQPLLMEIAPALLEKYFRTATPNDCLIAGPSGAGYIIPPLSPELPAYLRETCRVCQQAGISVVTFYVADPPVRILQQVKKHTEKLIGFLGGYASLNRAPQTRIGDAMFIANQWPTVPHLWDSAEEILEGVRKLIDEPGPRPRFIGVHLFAYRTTLADVAHFAAGLETEHVYIVRGDIFLHLAHSCSKIA
jgi:hypothetical protein